MFRSILTLLLIFGISSAAQAGIHLKIHCPLPNQNILYKNQYVYVEVIGKKTITPVIKKTDASGTIRLAHKYKYTRKSKTMVRISLSIPNTAPPVILPGCSTLPKAMYEGKNKINFNGSFSTNDCGVVNVKSVCMP